VVDIENEFDISNHVLEGSVLGFKSFLFADVDIDRIKPSMMSYVKIMDNALDICFTMRKWLGKISKIIRVNDSSDLFILFSQGKALCIFFL
jgi:hypothetical protein